MSPFLNARRYNPSDIYNLNYVTTYEGFTLYDAVSYEHKHNEDNGENNSDGAQYNFSWNCGVEGKTQKKAVKVLRLQQMKNLMTMLILSNSAPKFFMGDEFMNSQNGNNNPYCLDNDVTWLNWSLNAYNKELLEFTKMLLKFRQDNSVVNRININNYTNSINEFPDISYHQESAWAANIENYLHHVGVMLSNENETIYIAYNMHWENHMFGLPKLKKGNKWEFSFTTVNDIDDEIKTDLINAQDEICVYKRSILVLKSVKDDLSSKKINKKLSK